MKFVKNNSMLYIQRNQDIDEGGAAAPSTVNATEVPESTSDQSVNDAPDEDDDYFGAIGEQQNADGESGHAGTPIEPEQPTILASEYEKLKSELQRKDSEIQALKRFADNPLVQVAIQYAETSEDGIELNPVDFVNHAFGLDARKMSDEEVIRESVKFDAKTLGITLSNEELDEEYEQRLSDLQSKGTIARASEIKKMRDNLTSNSKGKLDEIIGQKKSDMDKAKEYNDFQVQSLESEMQGLLKDGKKEFGVRVPYDAFTDKAIRTMMANNMVKFDAKGNVDVKHYIETALFASDPVAYVRRIEKFAIQKAEAKSLKERSAKTETNPSGVPAMQNGTARIPENINPDDWNPSKAVAIS